MILNQWNLQKQEAAIGQGMVPSLSRCETDDVESGKKSTWQDFLKIVSIFMVNSCWG